jgi:DNA polymerase type B, organellar and viral
MRRDASARAFIGVDGEGQTIGRGRNHIGEHRYVFLAGANEHGAHWSVANDKGLDTETCLDFLLKTLPSKNTILFAYSFGYDLTKILVDLPDNKLHSLFRPDERLGTIDIFGKTRTGPQPIQWRGYKMNLQGSKFSVSRVDAKNEVVLWDIFKFYQSKFVAALRDWKVGVDLSNKAKYVRVDSGNTCEDCNKFASPLIRIKNNDKETALCIQCSLVALPLLERMQMMKEQRSVFDRLPKEQVQAYCYEECVCMAKLARKLVEAHHSAGLKLKSFYGAGSSASAMLNAMKIKEKIRAPREEMADCLASSFFGGRFENSVIGRIDGTVYNYDISSAYPYQITFLPCLMHGQWIRTTNHKDLETCRTAFVRYTLGTAPKDSRFESWGPFPFRTKDGSISFPIESGGGWIGLQEYLVGEHLFPNVRFVEAWIYECGCDCKPFAKIPEFYKQRILIGKEGPGIVLKLGYNACYGKLAQSIGGALFSNWIWASLITSGTRAQILELLGLHKNWSNLLMIATDGVYTRERLSTSIPRDTGTRELICPINDKCSCLACKANGGIPGIAHKPLGGWEEKAITKGVFIARPGIYFPLDPTVEELKDVRGRGVGKAIVLENWRKIVEHWEKYHLDPKPGYPEGLPCTVSNVQRFCGAKSSVQRSIRNISKNGTIEWSYGRSNGIGQCAGGCAHGACGHVPSYGQWITRPVEMNFHPRPKRERLREDRITLEIRRFAFDFSSAPYKKAITSQEALELIAAKEELLEQPDADFVDSGLNDVDD